MCSYVLILCASQVTIVPDLRIEESIGVKSVMNPTPEDMTEYIR